MDDDNSPAAIGGWLMFWALVIVAVGGVIGFGDYVRAEVQITKTKEVNRIKQYSQSTCFPVVNNFLTQEGWKVMTEADRFSLPHDVEISSPQPALKCRADDDKGVPYSYMAYQMYYRRAIKTTRKVGDA